LTDFPVWILWNKQSSSSCTFAKLQGFIHSSIHSSFFLFCEADVNQRIDEKEKKIIARSNKTDCKLKTPLSVQQTDMT